MARPGIMLYFDILEPIRVLPDADKGRLLVAMLEYGQSGKLPEFDGVLSMAWGFVKPKLDRDGESYENTKIQRKYAAFCKNLARLKLPKLSFEEWLDMDDNGRQRMLSCGNGNYGSEISDNEPQREQRSVDSVNEPQRNQPTTTVTLSPSTSITLSTAAAVTATGSDGAAAAAADRAVKSMGGELGKGVVFLSDAQIADLLDRMDVDAFDHYVDKLSCFIIKNNAKVKNHYETILRWWEEDAQIRSAYGNG